MTNVNITPLRLIRISKDLNAVQMGKIFGVSYAYISAVEKGQRKMHPDRLELGLIELGIPYDLYRELSSFCEMIDQKNLSAQDQFKFCLIKTIGITSPDLKEQSEQLLEQFLPLEDYQKVPIIIYQYQKIK